MWTLLCRYSNQQYTIPRCVKAVRENPVPVYISLSLNYLVLTACQAPVVKNATNLVGILQVTSYNNKFSCIYGRIFATIFVSASQFIVSVSEIRKSSNQIEFIQIVATTKFYCRNKDHKKAPVHTKYQWLQPVQNLSPNLYSRSDLLPGHFAVTCY